MEDRGANWLLCPLDFFCDSLEDFASFFDQNVVLGLVAFIAMEIPTAFLATRKMVFADRALST